MKKTITLILFSVIAMTASATIDTITCQNGASHFLPVTQNAVVGDTIHWVWVSGNHVVGPILTTDIPTGATMFNAPIDASHHTFDYVLTVAGSYHYVCHPSGPHGEDGFLTVSNASTVKQTDVSQNYFSFFPNPSTGKFTVSAPIAKGEITIYNLLGEQVYETKILNQHTEINLGTIPKGFYFIKADNGVAVTTKRIVIE